MADQNLDKPSVTYIPPLDRISIHMTKRTALYFADCLTATGYFETLAHDIADVIAEVDSKPPRVREAINVDSKPAPVTTHTR